MHLGETALRVTRETEATRLNEHFNISVNGLEVIGQPQFAEWERLAHTLRVAERGIQFALGDLINNVETQFGEMASQIVDASDWSKKTVDVYRWLASRIAPGDRRMDRLTIRHHLLVAALTPRQQRAWLARAAADEEENPWTVKRLQDALQQDGDVPEVGWWILVAASTAEEQVSLMDNLEAQGLSCKAVVRRRRRKQQEEEP